MTARLPSKPRLYFETLRHLKLVQITTRIKRMLWRQRFDSHDFDGGVRSIVRPWVPHAVRLQSQFGASEFQFLNVDGDVDVIGWDDPDVAKLWRYNLHYFDDLAASDADGLREWHRALIDRWIAENPPTEGSGWEPYPTSLRIVNWIKAELSGFDVGAAAQASLALQARWLFQNLEYHLLGNHLMTNARALLFAGHYFEGDEAARWRAKGAEILAAQLDEQILADGGHFELSPMYHALALEDILDVCNLLEALPVANPLSLEQLQSSVQLMRFWLAAMTHPDERFAHFNDCAQGIAPIRMALEDYAIRLGFGEPDHGFDAVTHLRDSGYIRVEYGGALAILDVGEIGPSYLPGHAHADTLSFELSLGGERIFVNGGTSVYGLGADRLAQRSTPSHNTVSVDGQDSSEVWSGFRVARRAKPMGLTIVDIDPIEISCLHDGYRRLTNGPYHRRSWTFADRQITINDALVEGKGSANAYFHLHPDCQLTIAPDGLSGTIVTKRSTIVHWHSGTIQTEIVPSLHHPDFGISLPTSTLFLPLVDGQSSLSLTWKP